MTPPVQQAGPLLSAVLTWCAEHPWSGKDLHYDDVTFQQRTAEDGTCTVSVLGDVPHVMAASTEILEAADPELVSFENGLLVLNVQPAKLLYQPLYVARAAQSVVFRRVCARCHGFRKVPDWTNWNHEYGEPRPKPCPECLEWPQ